MISNIKRLRRDKGFTIVELLVVIVVIGILAAIIIVSYSGVTNRAYTATAQNAADAVINKANVFFTESSTNMYPKTFTDLTGDNTKVYYIPPSTITPIYALLTIPTLPAGANSVTMEVCGGTDVAANAPATAAATTKPFGLRISYWNFSTGARVPETIGNVGTPVVWGGISYTTQCNYAAS